MPMASIVSHYIYDNNLFFVLFIFFVKPLCLSIFLFMTHSCRTSIMRGSLVDKKKDLPNVRGKEAIIHKKERGRKREFDRDGETML